MAGVVLISLCLFFIIYCRRRGSRRAANREVDLIMASESSVSAFMVAGPTVMHSPQQEGSVVVNNRVLPKRSSIRKGYDSRVRTTGVRTHQPTASYTNSASIRTDESSIPTSVVPPTHASTHSTSEPRSVISSIEAELRREMASMREEMGRMQAGVEGEHRGGDPPPAYD